MDLNEDFQDLINCFTSHHVDYVVVGAHALAFHGVARYTEDLDVWVAKNLENAQRIRLALSEFGVELGEDVSALLLDRQMIRLGNPPRRIEILNFLDGCDYEEASSRAIAAELGAVPVKVLGLDDYISTKRASGRPKDRSDLDLLEEALGKLPDAK